MRGSPEAGHSVVVLKGAATGNSFVPRLPVCFWLCAFCFLASLTPLPGQDGAQTPVAAPAAQSEMKQSTTELAAHDEPTTFKVNVRLVLVRTVVRDSQGHAVGNLHQEDFQVFDKGKPQVISHFDFDQPGSLAAKARPKPKE